MYSLSIRDVASKRHSVIIELFVVVHPHLGSPPGVPSENVPAAPRERVGVAFSKHVTNPRARYNFQAASALPDSKRDLCEARYARSDLSSSNSCGPNYTTIAHRDFLHPTRPSECRISLVSQNTIY